MSEKVNIYKGLASVLPDPKPEQAVNPVNELGPSEGEFDISKEFNDRMQVITPYLNLIENPRDIHDESQRPVIFAKLSYGLRKAGEAFAWILYHQKMAKVRRKEQEAIASLDDFPEYVKISQSEGKEVKATEGIRTAYVNQCSRVLAAYKHEALVDAYAEQLSTTRYEFIQAISTLKAMCYGMKDSIMMSSSASNSEHSS